LVCLGGAEIERIVVGEKRDEDEFVDGGQCGI
jgi:hypothetical protein